MDNVKPGAACVTEAVTHSQLSSGRAHCVLTTSNPVWDSSNHLLGLLTEARCSWNRLYRHAFIVISDSWKRQIFCKWSHPSEWVPILSAAQLGLVLGMLCTIGGKVAVDLYGKSASFLLFPGCWISKCKVLFFSQAFSVCLRMVFPKCAEPFWAMVWRKELAWIREKSNVVKYSSLMVM